jgi:hypothetical protein
MAGAGASHFFGGQPKKGCRVEPGATLKAKAYPSSLSRTGRMRANFLVMTAQEKPAPLKPKGAAPADRSRRETGATKPEVKKPQVSRETTSGRPELQEAGTHDKPVAAKNEDAG